MTNIRQSKNLRLATVADIKKALIDAELTVGDLATQIGKSRSAVSLAIHHPTVVPAVRKSVLKILNLQNV